MRQKIHYIYPAYFVLSLLLQLVLGNLNEVFFRFPLSIILLSLWLLLLFYFRKTETGKELSGKRAGLIAIGYAIACSLVVGVTPQLTPEQAAMEKGIAALLGCYDFIRSWFMAGAVLLLVSNLWLITLKRFNRKNIGFILNHTGLLMVLVAGYCGSADVVKLRAKINTQEPVNTAYRTNGTTALLPFTVFLQDFRVTYYPDKSPMNYTAIVGLNGGEQHCNLQVNHPAHYRGYDLYLISYGDGYCIIELQKQPWKYLLAGGIILMLGGAVSIFNRRRA